MEPPVSRNMLPPFVVLFGPTASGKTEILRKLASRQPCSARRDGPWFEIVSADSMQVYRGMNIGTAKPSADERRSLPHHLIDIRDPDEQFTVGDFVRESETCIHDIAARGRLPVVSGGTAFYLRALLCGLPETPPSDPDIRAEIESQRDERGLAAMHAQLEAIDPEGARAIDPHDAYRIVRALEVHRVSGRPRSAFRAPERLRDGLSCSVFELLLPRETLYARINERVDQMFARGLPDEVDRLRAAGFGKTTQALRAIGYREFFEADGRESGDLSRVRMTIQRNSRRYAKRQGTFAHLIPERIGIAPEEIGRIAEGCERMFDVINTARSPVDQARERPI